MYFQYGKIQFYLKEFRQEVGLPEWMQSFERVVEGSAKGRRRIATMRKNVAGTAEEKSGKTGH
jgi:hypothetical protein